VLLLLLVVRSIGEEEWRRRKEGRKKEGRKEQTNNQYNMDTIISIQYIGLIYSNT